jgi:transposase-like protein
MFTTSEDFTMAISIAKTNVNAPSSKLEDDTVRIVRPTNVSHTMM